jgi:Protein of unknown function (DUF4054)
VDVGTFRITYPAFADVLAYPTLAVQHWIDEASNNFDPIRWGGNFERGVALYTAHNLALNGPANSATPGVGAALGGGLVSSKAVGGVSVAYNYEVGAVERGGGWNLTLYGRQLLTLMRMVGAGVVQL